MPIEPTAAEKYAHTAIAKIRETVPLKTLEAEFIEVHLAMAFGQGERAGLDRGDEIFTEVLTKGTANAK